MASPLQKSVILTLFTFLQISALTLACPTQCSCILKTMTCDGSKSSTPIDEAALPKILEGIPQGTIKELVIKHANVSKLTQVLFSKPQGTVSSLTNFTMTSSNISQIESLAFKNFMQMTYLDLSDNNIVPENISFEELPHLKILKLKHAFKKSPNSTLPENLFRRLEKLEILDLSSNGMSEIPLRLLNEVCLNLKSLDISENVIHNLRNDTFKKCLLLTNLKIENSKMDGMDKNAFGGLESLMFLNIQGNNLHSLTISHIEPIKNATINLDDNPWTCDCSFIFLVEWLTKETSNFDLICQWPLKLAKRRLSTLNAYNLGCENPKVKAVSKNPVILIEGDNATYVVDAIGLPYVSVNCTHAKKSTNAKIIVSYRHSIHIDLGIQHHYSNIRMDFINMKVSDSGNITCHVRNLLGEDKLVISLQVRKDDDGKRIDIVIFVTGIMLFVIAVGLLIACLNIRNKKQAEKEAKAQKLKESKGHENHAFEENVKSKYRRRDSIGYFPTSTEGKTALTPSV